MIFHSQENLLDFFRMSSVSRYFEIVYCAALKNYVSETQ